VSGKTLDAFVELLGTAYPCGRFKVRFRVIGYSDGSLLILFGLDTRHTCCSEEDGSKVVSSVPI